MRPVLQALRDWLDGRPQQVALDHAAVRWAEPHRLRGALYHIGAILGDQDSALCQDAWARNVATHLARVRLLSSVWPVGAPPPLIYKGADLVENVFDDPGARSSVDLDALLPTPYFEPVAAELEKQADAVTVPAYERYPDERPFAYGFRFGEYLLELHAEPQPPHRCRLRGEDVWGRGTAGRLGRLEVRFPTPEDRALLWLTNQAKGAFFGDCADWLDWALVGGRVGASQARAVGLGKAYELAQVRMAQTGLRDAQTTFRARQVARLLPAADQTHVHPNQAVFQGTKLWLCDPQERLQILGRGVSALWRR